MPAKATKKAKTKVTPAVEPFYADMQNLLVIAAVIILFVVLVMVLFSMGRNMTY